MKIILTLIFIFNCSAAFAKVDLNSMSRDERNALFARARKETPDSQQWFIPRRTVKCQTREGIRKIYNRAINSNGQVNVAYLSHLGCSMDMDRWNIGVVADPPKKGSNIVGLMYGLDYGDAGLAYFYAPSLTSLEQRKKMNIN